MQVLLACVVKPFSGGLVGEITLLQVKKRLLDNRLASRRIDEDQQLELGKGVAFVPPFFPFSRMQF